MASSLEEYRSRAVFSVPEMQDVLIGREVIDFKQKVSEVIVIYHAYIVHYKAIIICTLTVDRFGRHLKMILSSTHNTDLGFL